MSQVVWDARARSDMRAMVAYIAPRNAKAAQSLKTLIESSAERLSAFPYIHRVGRTPGTREAVVHPNYILVYAVQADAIRVLRLLHARQQYP